MWLLVMAALALGGNSEVMPAAASISNTGGSTRQSFCTLGTRELNNSNVAYRFPPARLLAPAAGPDHMVSRLEGLSSWYSDEGRRAKEARRPCYTGTASTPGHLELVDSCSGTRALTTAESDSKVTGCTSSQITSMGAYAMQFGSMACRFVYSLTQGTHRSSPMQPVDADARPVLAAFPLPLSIFTSVSDVQPVCKAVCRCVRYDLDSLLSCGHGVVRRLCVPVRVCSVCVFCGLWHPPLAAAAAREKKKILRSGEGDHGVFRIFRTGYLVYSIATGSMPAQAACHGSHGLIQGWRSACAWSSWHLQVALASGNIPLQVAYLGTHASSGSECSRTVVVRLVNCTIDCTVRDCTVERVGELGRNRTVMLSVLLSLYLKQDTTCQTGCNAPDVPRTQALADYAGKKCVSILKVDEKLDEYGKVIRRFSKVIGMYKPATNCWKDAITDVTENGAMNAAGLKSNKVKTSWYLTDSPGAHHGEHSAASTSHETGCNESRCSISDLFYDLSDCLIHELAYSESASYSRRFDRSHCVIVPNMCTVSSSAKQGGDTPGSTPPQGARLNNMPPQDAHPDPGHHGLGNMPPQAACPGSGSMPLQGASLGAHACTGCTWGEADDQWLLCIPRGSIPRGSIPYGSLPYGSIPFGSIPCGSMTCNALYCTVRTVECSHAEQERHRLPPLATNPARAASSASPGDQSRSCAMAHGSALHCMVDCTLVVRIVLIGCCVECTFARYARRASLVLRTVPSMRRGAPLDQNDGMPPDAPKNGFSFASKIGLKVWQALALLLFFLWLKFFTDWERRHCAISKQLRGVRRAWRNCGEWLHWSSRVMLDPKHASGHHTPSRGLAPRTPLLRYTRLPPTSQAGQHTLREPPQSRGTSSTKWAERLFIAACTAGLAHAVLTDDSSSASPAPGNAFAPLIQLFAAWHCIRFAACTLASAAFSALRGLHRWADHSAKHQLGGALELYYLVLLFGTLWYSHSQAAPNWPQAADTHSHPETAYINPGQRAAPPSSTSALGHLGEMLVALLTWHVARLLAPLLCRCAIWATAACLSTGCRHAARAAQTPPKTMLRTGFKLLVCILCASAVWSECAATHRPLRPSNATCCPSSTPQWPARVTRHEKRSRILAARSTRRKLLRVLCRLSAAPPVGIQHVRWKAKGGSFNPYGSEGPGAEFSDLDAELENEADYDSDTHALPELAGDSSDDDDHRPRGPATADHDSDSDDDAPASTNAAAPHNAQRGDQGSGATPTSWMTAIIKPWDWLLSDSQKEIWVSAEKTAKCPFPAHSKADTRKKNKAAKSAPFVPSGAFTASNAYVGTFDGYEYRTGIDGTGYFLGGSSCSTPPEPEPRVNDNNTVGTDDAPPEPPRLRPKRARRYRNEHGGRRKGTTRGTACSAAAAVATFFAATASLSDSWWKDSGLWAIDTANTNCIDTAHDNVLCKTSADITCLQETRLRSQQAIDAAKARMRRVGHSAHCSLAATTEAGKGSGGCAVTVRKGIGISPADEGLVSAQFAHRIAAAHVSGVVAGGVHIISVYLKDTEGLSEYNLRVLQEVGALVRTLGGPWIIAADWNIQPDALRAASWLKVAQGSVVTTTLPTCNDHTYDYFVVSNCLLHTVAGVQRLDDANLSPHSPCRLLLRADGRRHAARKLHRAPRVPAALPHGPMPKPPDYSMVHDAAETKSGIAGAMVKWYQLARQEWAALAGTKMQYRDFGLKWGCAAGNPSRTPSSALAGAWREAAKRAEDIARLKAQEEKNTLCKPRREALAAHLAAIKQLSSKLPNGVPTQLKAKLSTWVERLERALKSGDKKSALSLVGAANILAKQLETDTKADRMKEWRNAIGATGDDGAARTPTRLAYRWLKGLTGWSKSPLGPQSCNDSVPDQPQEHDEDPDLPQDNVTAADARYKGSDSVQQFCGSARLTPLCDQAVVETEANQWAKLWQEGQKYPELQWGHVEPLPELTVEALRAAANSFPLGTGLGVDNASPRAFARLSDDSLAALAQLLMKIEKTGVWPPSLNLVLIVLLAKGDGGFRPIGLLPSVIRIWMRARATQARAWEAVNHTSSVYGGRGMGAQRAAWVEAFNAEAAVLEKEEQAQALLDLTKAFELVDHQLLLEAAKKRGYPLALLRLSLAAYRLERTVGIDGHYSRPVLAQRGITAGSGFATTELRMLLMDVMDATFEAHGRAVSLTLYVDDLTIAVRGTARTVAKRLASAVDLVVNVFQNQLALKVSTTKSTVVASTLRLAARVARKSKAKILGHAKHAKLLGSAAGGGKRRSTTIAVQRLNKYRQCAGRMWQLRGSGVNTKQMARTAGTPAVMYGCDVQGVSTSLLDKQASTIARTAAPPGSGKNPTATLYVLDGPAGTLDPNFEAHVLLVKHLALAWWEDWVPVQSLIMAHDRVTSKFGDTSPSWNAAAGPTAALWLSLRRVGWRWDKAHELTDDLGHTWDLRCDPPVAVASAMHSTVTRVRLAKVAAVHPGLIPRTPDVGASRKGASDIIVDFSNILAPLAGGKVARLAETPEFCRKHASSLLSAAVGGQWPQARKAAVRKWNISDNRCQLCLEAVGTAIHRLSCKCNVPEVGWSATPPTAKLAERIIGADRRELLATTGLLTVRLPALSSTRYDTWQWGLRPADELPDDVVWYIDGSVMNPRRKQLATCGFALAAVTREGDLCAWGWGVPPRWCDSASAAEAWALCTVLRLSPGHPRIITDCLGLVHTAANGTAAATTSKKHLARVWRHIAGTLDGRLEQLVSSNRLIWMPAHKSATAIGQACKSNASPVTARDWRSNRLVDGLAKLAANDGAAPQASVQLVQSAEALVRHKAAQLAVATFNANNHKWKTTRADGSLVTRTIRDSVDIPHPKKAKSLAPLAKKAPPVTTVTQGTACTEQGSAVAGDLSSSDSSASALASRKQRKQRERTVRYQRDTQLADAALHSILRQKRLSHQEHAIDLHRRQLAAKNLLGRPEQPEEDAWGSFFELVAPEPDLQDPCTSNSASGNGDPPASSQQDPRDGASGERPPQAPCLDAPRLQGPRLSSPTSGSARCSAHCAPASSGSASSQTDTSARCASASLGNAGSSTAPPALHSFAVCNDRSYSRLRPTRGSSACTAASAAAAVRALVGSPAAESRGGSTRGQPR